MNHFRWIATLGCLNFLILSFTSSSLPAQADIIQPVIKIRVVKIKGEVFYQRSGFEEPEPISQEYSSTSDDDVQIHMYPGSQLRIFCNGKPKKRLIEARPKPFSLSKECPTSDSKLGKVATCREGITQNIPSIVSPRYTLISETKPTIRWYAVDDATTYEVIFFKENEIRDQEWSKLVYSVDDPRIHIELDNLTGVKIITLIDPLGQPELEIGGNYQLEIKAILKNGQTVSSQDDIRQLGKSISICFPPKNGISKLRFQVEKEGLDSKFDDAEPEDAKRISSSIASFEKAFHAKAIDIRSVLFRKTQEPSNLIELAENYKQLGLYLLTKGAYKRAISLAEKSKQEGYGKQARSELNELCKEINQGLCLYGDCSNDWVIDKLPLAESALSVGFLIQVCELSLLSPPSDL